MQFTSNATVELGALARVGLRQVWGVEHRSFTPWLAAHLDLLGEAIDIPLSLKGQETDIGTFRADILAKDTATGQAVLIENQLERTDHTHLGQLITYAAGVRAGIVVWIADTFTDEHRAGLDWLNESTPDSIKFFGVEIELWRIGESQIAPRFNVVSAPNAWARTVTRTVTRTVAPAVGSKKERAFLFIAYYQRQHEGAEPTLETIMEAVGCSQGAASNYRSEYRQQTGEVVAVAGMENAQHPA